MAGTYPIKKKTPGITYEQIVRDVRAGNIKPVYFLMGEESYYIDRVAEFIVNFLLIPEEQDFSLVTLFGLDTDVDAIMTAARSYPMGAKYNVIWVKEAQNLKHLDRLELYFRQVMPTTVLIFSYKNGNIDRRMKVASLISKEGVLFESKKLYDSQLPVFVRDYLKRRRVGIEPEASEMLAAFVGSDLNRLASEMDKLIVSLPDNEKVVTTQMVRQNIGVTRNFNVFELLDALGAKDALKVFSIAKYFDSNPKENPIQMILPSLFKYFSNLMLAYYSPDKSERGLAAWLGLTEWQVRKNVMPPMKVYSGVKVMNIISEIRHTDARSKGVENPATSNGDLMKELLFFILN